MPIATGLILFVLLLSVFGDTESSSPRMGSLGSQLLSRDRADMAVSCYGSVIFGLDAMALQTRLLVVFPLGFSSRQREG